MTSTLKTQLLAIAREKQTQTDPSHDSEHIRRVLNMAEKIGEVEGADMDILIPATLFHDIVSYPKNSPQRANETEESAILAGEILNSLKDYPKEKIEAVQTCIRECSFTKGTPPSSLESTILQDSDRLESTGAISIIRSFSSGGGMGRQFYRPEAPLDQNVDQNVKASVDLFYLRLLKIKDTLKTKTAQDIGAKRHVFLQTFLTELEDELKDSGII